MSESELDAAYGPVHSVYRVRRAQLFVGLAASFGFFVVGAGFAWASSLFHRDGVRSATEGGLFFVALFLGLVVPIILVRAMWRASSDTLELRAMGLVRRSKTFGLKHCRYADLARIEHHVRRGGTTAIDAFTRQDTLIRLHGFDRDPLELMADLEARAKSAGADVRRETIAIA